jgi:hypothetical protein
MVRAWYTQQAGTGFFGKLLSFKTGTAAFGAALCLKKRWKGKCANIVIVSFFVHHSGALGASIRGEGGERFICALCEGLIQRVLTRFLLVKLCNNRLPRMEAQQKQCPKCGIVRPFDEFGRHTRRKDGLQGICKQCDCLRRKEYVKNNPIQAIVSDMLVGARNRARKKNLPFDIDLDYVRSLICSHCSLLTNVSLDWSRGTKKGAPRPNSPSLDRIDPTKGYVKGNVWIVSHRANAIKGDATHDELKAIAENTGRALANSLDW